jgi:hypothetical protein
VPGPDGGPGTPSCSPPEPTGVVGALVRAGRLLDLLGRKCCVGRGYAAWERLKDQEPSAGNTAGEPEEPVADGPETTKNTA